MVKKEVGILEHPIEKRVKFMIAGGFLKVIKRGVRTEGENVDVLDGFSKKMFW